ncbi:MAG: NUDIX hydrolase [Gammaproteobacteria bacterium]|nr:NUDIX hydrolase [Gammaproteobacteria bacterium]
MKFCSRCGSEHMVWRVPEGDNRPRHVCDSCSEIFYQNPNIVAGCVPVWGEQILLCKRAIEPRYGLWTLPAGFMENGETTAEAAARETWEEASTRVEVGELFAVFNLPQINQVYMMFLAVMPALEFGPGTESLDCRLYDEPDIPWDQLAFPTITHTLRYFFDDRRRGSYALHFADIVREGGETILLARRDAAGPDAEP